MILTEDDIKSFANLTDYELGVVKEVKDNIRLRPNGKLQIQGQALNFDELSVKLCEVIFALQFQLSNDELTKEKLLAKYYHDKMGLYKDKELYFKFINDESVDSTHYKNLVLKTDRLKSYIKNLDHLLWTIKSRVETLRIAHSTDY
jgi:hypothetical protein